MVGTVRRLGGWLAPMAGAGMVLFATGLVSAPQLSAQRQTVRPGVYEVAHFFTRESPPCKYPDCWLEDKVPFPDKSRERLLYILNATDYVWGTFYGHYKITREATPTTPAAVYLCGKDWGGDVTPDARAPQMSFYAGDTSLGSLQKYVTLFGQNKTYPSPIKVEPVQLCADEKKLKSGSANSMSGDARSFPLMASMQPQAASFRGVSGELFLTFEIQDGSAADRELFICLVTGGYPGLEFVEQPGGRTSDVYVWPDGRFRTPLQGGATYHLWIRTTKCNTAARQDSGTSIRVPFRSAASGADTPDEKIVLTCFVSRGGFANCRAWWLAHP